MIKCSNCGAEVEDGKFCEKCGAPLNQENVINYGNSLFDKLKNQANKAATDLLAIRSELINGNLIYKVNKIPSVQEKKIKIENGEIVYYDIGNGFEKKLDTFVTTDNNFTCYYVKSETKINTVISNVVRSKIMKIETNDQINIQVRYSFLLNVNDIDTFFYKLVNTKQDTWRMMDVNQLLSNKINEIVINCINENLLNVGGADLRDIKGQTNKYTKDIDSKVAEYVKEYGLNVENSSLESIMVDVNEINKILIKYIYR